MASGTSNSIDNSSSEYSCIDLYRDLMAEWAMEDEEFLNQRGGVDLEGECVFPIADRDLFTYKLINNEINYERYIESQAQRQKQAISSGHIKKLANDRYKMIEERYIPGKRSFITPKYSILTKATMEKTFSNFFKCKSLPRSNFYRDQVLQENNEFQLHAKEVWTKQNYTRALSLDPNVNKLIDKYWQIKIDEVRNSYPSSYNQIGTFPLTIPKEDIRRIHLDFKSTVHCEGEYLSAKRPFVRSETRLTTDETEFDSWINFIKPQDFTSYTLPVSQDKLAADIAQKTNSSFVMTASSIKAILNNHPANHYENSWMIPVQIRIVKDTATGIERKCIFLDKKLPPKHNLTKTQKLHWFCKLMCKKFTYDFTKEFKEHSKIKNENRFKKYKNDKKKTKFDKQSNANSTDQENENLNQNDVLKQNVSNNATKTTENNEVQKSELNLDVNNEQHIDSIDNDQVSNSETILDAQLTKSEELDKNCDQEIVDSSNDTEKDVNKDSTLVENVDDQNEDIHNQSGDAPELFDEDESVDDESEEDCGLIIDDPYCSSNQSDSENEEKCIDHTMDTNTSQSNSPQKTELPSLTSENKETQSTDINNPLTSQTSTNPSIDTSCTQSSINLLEFSKLLQSQSTNKNIKTSPKNKVPEIQKPRNYDNEKLNGFNRSYSLWKLYEEYQPGDELMKNKKQVPLNIVIRSKHDAKAEYMHSYDKKKYGFYNITPKVDYQSEFGAEVLSLHELLDEWASLYIRLDTELLRVRVAHDNLEVIMCETESLSDLQNKAQALYDTNPKHCIGNLYSILWKLMDLAEGSYLLTHDPKSNAFVNVYKHDITGSHFPFAGWECHEGIVRRPWLQIDTTVITPTHNFLKVLPAMFPPTTGAGQQQIHNKRTQYHKMINDFKNSNTKNKKKYQNMKRRERKAEKEKAKT